MNIPSHITIKSLLANTIIKSETGCMEWQSARSRSGYGRKAINGQSQYVHRIIATLAYGSNDKSAIVMHSCDNPPCCNPEHLSWGTYRQNIQDMFSRGRARNNPRKGEEHGMAKLRKEDVVEIRILYKQGFTQQDLSKIYKVSISQIHLIVSRKEWKEVPEIGDFFTK